MRLARHWQALVVLVLGVVVTIVFTVDASQNYESNQQRLTNLQTKLTGSVLQTAQPQLNALLGRVVGLAAEAPDPVASFRQSMASQIVPRGRYSTAALVEVQGTDVRELDHLGAAPLRSIQSKASTNLYLQAAHSTSLITTRVVSGKIQRLGFLLSARSGPTTSYVIGLSQTLPRGHPISEPAGSPYANLNFALYFGRVVHASTLVATNVGHLPLSGPVARTTVPFGNNSLTLVASPKGSLAGSGAEYLPWVILLAGLALTISGAALTDYLVRRRREAESAALESEEQYQEQRARLETLQRFLLPRVLPDIAGFRFAADYLPATRGTEVGGDWYSVLKIDDFRFAIVIGDVSGHGMSAASTMASARYTIRTLASLGFAPDEIILRTRDLLETGARGRLITTLVGVMDVRTRQLALASAGHLPPLLIRNGIAQLVELVPGVPVGVKGGRTPVTFIDFTPGSTLIAFTDGLVERRGEAIDVGLQRLVTAASVSSAGPEALISTLLLRCEVEDHEDDIALLAVEFLGSEDASHTTGGPGKPGSRGDRAN